MVTPRQILDIVEIAIYAPVLIIATFLCIKHGLRQSLSSISIVVLSLLRIIGGGTGIAAVDHPSQTSLLTCSLVCSFIGLSPLLQTMIAFVRRVHKNSSPSAIIPGRIMHLLGIPVLVALILGILAGTKLFSTDPSTVSEGHKFSHASSIIYTITLVLIGACTIITLLTRSRISPSDSKLLYASLLVLPFVFVRVVYQLCVSFDYTDTNTFSLFTDATHPVLVEGLMSLMMEYTAVIIYIVAALLTPRDSPVVQGNNSHHEMSGYGASQREAGYVDTQGRDSYGSSKPQYQQQSSMGGGHGGPIRDVLRNGPIRSAIRGFRQ